MWTFTIKQGVHVFRILYLLQIFEFRTTAPFSNTCDTCMLLALSFANAAIVWSSCLDFFITNKSISINMCPQIIMLLLS